jgi:hypothetical protein
MRYENVTNIPDEVYPNFLLKLITANKVIEENDEKLLEMCMSNDEKFTLPFIFTANFFFFLFAEDKRIITIKIYSLIIFHFLQKYK